MNFCELAKEIVYRGPFYPSLMHTRVTILERPTRDTDSSLLKTLAQIIIYITRD
jgi:hypothetical protein